MLEITGWEDRSGLPEPGPDSFGYVYFSDDSRVGYSPGAEGHGPLWEPRTNGGGKYKPVTQKHLDMAATLLKEKGVLS